MVNRTKKPRWVKYAVAAAIVIAVVLVIALRKPGGSAPMVRTASVERGTVTLSVSANGTLKPFSTVEVKSNVGGQIVELAVDEGDVVSAGQLIARIDPSDSESNLLQSTADLNSAQARVQQTIEGLDLQNVQTATGIVSAQKALETERKRLEQAASQAKAQPELTQAAIKQAESNLAQAQSALKQIKTASVPQKLSSAQAAYDQAKAAFDRARNDLERKRALLDKGFVSKSQVDTANEQYSSASAQLDSARSKLETIRSETDQDIIAAEARVAQAQAALETARTNRVQDSLRQQDLAAARAAVEQARAALDSARAGSHSVKMKKEDVTQARAQLARAQAAADNARIQLGYTTIVAPSSGVVVKKYVEKGSMVTAGKSAFAGSGSGVTVVDIADINRMVVEVNVDEADISQIRTGQNVDVSVDAYPDDRFQGKVTKIAPQAVMDQNVTTVPVTVEITKPDRRLKPEMNATCEFIVARKSNVLLVPGDAVSEGRDGPTVNVVRQGKQEPRRVQIGIVGTSKTEIVGGLSEGEVVVTAVIEPTSTTATPAPGRGPGRGGPPPF